MDLKLAGKKALVTGGTRGIGRAIVQLLVAEGAKVATCARNAAEVSALQDMAAGNGQAITASVCDVGDKDAYEAWIGDNIALLGGADIFIANVSGGAVAGEEGWRRSFDVDLMATVRGCEAVLPTMAEHGGGAIVIISSISGIEAFGGPGAYGTIKAGLVSYSGQLAEAAAAHGVRVNCVSPGPIHVDDGFWGDMKTNQPEAYEAVCNRHASGRMGTTEEVANAAVFLASGAASWITGTNMIVDGGMTKRVQF